MVPRLVLEDGFQPKCYLREHGVRAEHWHWETERKHWITKGGREKEKERERETDRQIERGREREEGKLSSEGVPV